MYFPILGSNPTKIRFRLWIEHHSNTRFHFMTRIIGAVFWLLLVFMMVFSCGPLVPDSVFVLRPYQFSIVLFLFNPSLIGISDQPCTSCALNIRIMAFGCYFEDRSWPPLSFILSAFYFKKILHYISPWPSYYHNSPNNTYAA